MAGQSATAAEKGANKRSSKSASRAPQHPDEVRQSQLRVLRLERGLTQEELADKSGMHRNSLGRLERGTSKEVTREKAMALAEVLQVPVSRLGLRVRPNVEARSVRFRRFIVDEILSLPPEAYDRLREVIETLRTMPEKRSRGMRA